MFIYHKRNFIVKLLRSVFFFQNKHLFFYPFLQYWTKHFDELSKLVNYFQADL